MTTFFYGILGFIQKDWSQLPGKAQKALLRTKG